MRSECQQTAGYSSDDPSCVASVEVYPHNAHFFLDIARCFIDAPPLGCGPPTHISFYKYPHRWGGLEFLHTF